MCEWERGCRRVFRQAAAVRRAASRESKPATVQKSVRGELECGGGSSPTELEEVGSEVWGARKRVGDCVFVFDEEIELLYAT